jgi:hypothetical protein
VLADVYGKMIYTRIHTVSAKELNVPQPEAIEIGLFQQAPRFDPRTVALDANLLSRPCLSNLIKLSYSVNFIAIPRLVCLRNIRPDWCGLPN